ncbi:MAG: hypothetical protein JWM11_2707 [Planctomycetaceae bacterium]|nr:hypothetical protein [Planctomycetaceae bacterium]
MEVGVEVGVEVGGSVGGGAEQETAKSVRKQHAVKATVRI